MVLRFWRFRCCSIFVVHPFLNPTLGVEDLRCVHGSPILVAGLDLMVLMFTKKNEMKVFGRRGLGIAASRAKLV